MPALRSLYINLEEEDQVDLLMRLLPELEYLNGLPVDRDQLEDEDNNAIAHPDSTNDPALAVRIEANKNVGDSVDELPDEEDSDTEIVQQTQDEENEKMNSSLMSL